MLVPSIFLEPYILIAIIFSLTLLFIDIYLFSVCRINDGTFNFWMNFQRIILYGYGTYLEYKTSNLQNINVFAYDGTLININQLVLVSIMVIEGTFALDYCLRSIIEKLKYFTENNKNQDNALKVLNDTYNMHLQKRNKNETDVLGSNVFDVCVIDESEKMINFKFNIRQR